VDAGRNVSGARGEAYLVVDGDQRSILFTNRALAEAERLIGKGLFGLIMEGKRELTFEATAQLLWVGMEHARRESRAGGAAYKIADAWAVMDTCGIGPCVTAIFEAVTAVMSYDGGKHADESPPLGTGSGS
jgi:hypothetical protein